MPPIPESDIFFISEEDRFNNRKGVTVSKFREEIRIAVWYFVKKEGGYITPRERGVSLSPGEYHNLKAIQPEIEEKISQLSASRVSDYLSEIKSKGEVDALRRKLDDIERGLNCDMTDSPKKTKKTK